MLGGSRGVIESLSRTMDLNKQKEQFSIAYVRAVIAAAGFTVYTPEVDDDSIDLGITGSAPFDLPIRPRVEVQLKSTANQRALHQGQVHFPLKIKNYDDLRLPSLVPRVLLLVVMPDDVSDWLRHTEEELVLSGCGYWLSLFGYPSTENTESVTVQIPRAQQFTPEALRAIMKRVNDGEAI